MPAVAAQITPHNTTQHPPNPESTIRQKPQTTHQSPPPANPFSNMNLSNSRAPHARRSGLIRPETTAQYSDARWVTQAPQGRITHRSNSRSLLLFPEPTKNQRLRSTARFLVESARSVKKKAQQSYPHLRFMQMGLTRRRHKPRIHASGHRRLPAFPRCLASKLCST